MSGQNRIEDEDDRRTNSVIGKLVDKREEAKVRGRDADHHRGREEEVVMVKETAKIRTKSTK